ncbi:hypothetical protein [Streptomyces sp. NPDC088785]|uniref:hypothetical protein n=1 Tax=Streptomyces sp. NPDC088785 TaxID=3365897 RepID=UPI00381C1C09
MARLFPERLIRATDAVLDVFESELAGVRVGSDEAVFGVVRRVVLALNDVDEGHDGAAYETGERELLCAYIDLSLGERGVDVAALTGRRGLERYELTDEWRDW